MGCFVASLLAMTGWELRAIVAPGPIDRSDLARSQVAAPCGADSFPPTPSTRGPESRRRRAGQDDRRATVAGGGSRGSGAVFAAPVLSEPVLRFCKALQKILRPNATQGRRPCAVVATLSASRDADANQAADASGGMTAFAFGAHGRPLLPLPKAVLPARTRGPRLAAMRSDGTREPPAAAVVTSNFSNRTRVALLRRTKPAHQISSYHGLLPIGRNCFKNFARTKVSRSRPATAPSARALRGRRLGSNSGSRPAACRGRRTFAKAALLLIFPFDLSVCYAHAARPASANLNPRSVFLTATGRAFVTRANDGE